MAGLIQKTSIEKEVKKTFEERDTDCGSVWYVSLLLLQYDVVKEWLTTALLVAKRQVWYSTIKHDLTCLERLFEVNYDDNNSIVTLKKKVKGKKQISLPADKLTV